MNQTIINILLSGTIILIISSSFNLIYYPNKFFHIAHAIVITSGAYFVFMFSNQFHFPFAVAVILSVFLSILIGMIIEKAIYLPLRRRNVSSMLMLVASLGVYVVLQNVVSMVWGDDTKSIRIGDVQVGNKFFGAYITNIQVITIIVSMVLVVSSIIFMKYHKIGRSIRAVSANNELANIMGINSDNVILWSFAIGSGMASIAGILVAYDTGLTPTMGFNLLLYGVVAMIIGGVGSTWGLIGGAILLATGQHLTAYYIDSKWMDAVTYSILIFFLIWKPLGFSGKRLKKTEI